MKVLILGSGGREYALAVAIAKSSVLDELYVAPFRDAFSPFATPMDCDIENFVEVVRFCKSYSVDLVIIGPESILASGLSDFLMEEGVCVFGPNKAAARLESSKSFTKELCLRYNVPGPHFGCFVDRSLAMRFIENKLMKSSSRRSFENKSRGRVVIKADGLAAGKGTFICNGLDECDQLLTDVLENGMLGAAGDSVVIEEYLEGEEVSFFALVDGTNAVVLGVAQDHKRLLDGDAGPNTGGMGAYSPVPFVSQELEHLIVQQVVYPAVQALYNMGISYRGVLFAGLMLTSSGPKLLEYNVRFGDPELQVLLPRIDQDILRLISLTARGKLGTESVKLKSKTVLCVVVASKGYPLAGSYVSSEIGGLESMARLPGIQVVHGATKLLDSAWYSDGGRVIDVVADGLDISEAKHRAYAALDLLDWSDGFFRYDIGHRAMFAP